MYQLGFKFVSNSEKDCMRNVTINKLSHEK